MKYEITNKENPFFGNVFDGSPVTISEEKRIWDNDSQGRSYPEKDCIMTLDESQAQQLFSLRMCFPYRICFAVFVDGEFRTYAETTKRKMNGFAKLGYPIFTLK